MKFPAALQALCNEHRVKLLPGLKMREVGGKPEVYAVISAYKLDDEGKVIAEQEFQGVVPE